MYTAIENNPILISLTALAKDSGWTVNGTVASHSSCNDGNLYLLNFPLTTGQTYRYTYEVLTRSSGYVEAFLGTNHGNQITTTGLVDETIVANGADLYFYSNGTLSIDNFSIEVVASSIDPYQKNTIAYSEKSNKWVSFYSYIPDNAFSLYTNLYSFYQGRAYVHEHNSSDRCNFYGVQYPSTVIFSTNQQPSITKTFSSINYQANQLLITPASGINTANGQISELITEDFLQQTLVDGSITINEYQTEGIYDANFLRDMTVDINNGEFLQGNWLTIGLQTTSPSTPLKLFSTEIIYSHSYSNTR